MFHLFHRQKGVIPIELRDYQIEAIGKTALAWRNGYRRPCIVLPCGGGKSIITAEMAKRTTDRGNRGLFLVHRRELCEQIENTFTSWGVNMNDYDPTINVTPTLDRDTTVSSESYVTNSAVLLTFDIDGTF